MVDFYEIKKGLNLEVKNFLTDYIEAKSHNKKRPDVKDFALKTMFKYSITIKMLNNSLMLHGVRISKKGYRIEVIPEVEEHDERPGNEGSGIKPIEDSAAQ
jgi:hypothetical protein